MRHFTRIPFQASTVLAATDGSQEWQCELIDISLKGALITRPANWAGQRGDSLELKLLLTDEGEKLTFSVDVAHIEDEQVGFEVMHMDLDSATHLKRLVELNLGNEALLERELNELINATAN